MKYFARLALMGILVAGIAQAADVKLLLPLGRVAYQTNELIDLAIVRSDKQALAAGEMTLTLAGEDGSRIACKFPASAAAVDGADARITEHLRINGWLLRPGSYSITVAVDGTTAQAPIEVYSHVRESTFKLIDWASHAQKKEQALLGEKSMGFNLIYAAYGGISPDDLIRGGADYMRCCTMGGGHQMDLRQECDWSDPYALIGGEVRVVREALADRTHPNCIGVHYYDEPGLSWMKHPKTGVTAAFNLPAQDRSYKSAFGVDAPQYCDVKPDDPIAVARWYHMNRWKFAFMEAAWKFAQFGVSWVRPDLINCTQSVYGVAAYADGYYFNAVRCLPVISGHGGYSDWGPGYWHPSWTMEFGRVRDLAKPNWYLPMWFNMSGENFRMEQYLSFMMNLQGMCKPPDFKIQQPNTVMPAEGIVESNKLMAQLGTIFNTMPIDRGDVAVLHSVSQMLFAEVRDMQDPSTLNKSAYEGGGHSRWKCQLAYVAGKMIHVSLFPVVEEDILDGTVATHHKALVIAGVDYLDPKVVSALEAWIAGGGAVLLSDDSKVKIKGATPVGCALTMDASEKVQQLFRESQKGDAAAKKEKEAVFRKLDTTRYYMDAATPFAKALKARLDALNIKPAMDADSDSICTQRQAYGDVEYLFAVNATYNEAEGKRNSIKPASATLSIAADGRNVYDAIHGALASEFKEAGGQLKASFRFGAGQMRVFARTNKAIGGVDVQTPLLTRDYTLAQSPVKLTISANVVDTHQCTISGSIPMQIRVVDPLGVTRYELFRATDGGNVKLSVQLGVNDPAGEWKVIVRELLSRMQGQATFTYKPPAFCGAIAGAVPRALYFGNDRDNAFRMFRLHQNVTIIKGKSEYNAAAAQRLTETLRPWNVRCTVVDAADVKPRQMLPEELRTWCGLEPGRLDGKQPPNPNQVGFEMPGAAIVIGTPEDNPIIKFALVLASSRISPTRATSPAAAADCSRGSATPSPMATNRSC